MQCSWKKNFYAVWIAEFMAIAAFGSANPIIPFYIQELGVSDPVSLKMWSGLVQTSGSIMVAIFAPIWGRVADSYGRRLMFLRALFGGAVMMFLMGVSTHPWQLVLFRGIGGIFTGTVAAATMLVASTVPRDKVGYGLGMMQTGIMIGSAIGPILGGTIADLMGFRASFIINAGVFLISGFIVLFYVKEDFTPRPITRGRFWNSVLPDFSVLFRSRELLTLILVVAFIQLASSALSPVLPFFIRTLLSDTALLGTTSGLIIGIGAFSGAAAAALIGRTSDRLGYRRVLVIGLTGAMLVNILLIFVTATWQLVILRLLSGMFLGGTIPMVNALIVLKSDADSQGTLFGLSSSISSTGNAVGPAIGASIAAFWGFPPVFLFIGFCMGLGAAMVLLFVRKAAVRTPPELAA